MFNQIGGQNAIGSPLSPDQIGGESFIRHIGNDKLIYDFHEGSGTVVYDKSHCNNNGTFKGVGEPAWKRNEVIFDGVNDYIDCGSDSSLVLGTGDFTIEVYALCVSSPKTLYPAIITRGLTGTGDWMLRVYSNTYQFRYWGGETVANTTNSEDNKYHHIIIIRLGDNTYIFFDNRLEGTVSGTGSLNLNTSVVLTISLNQVDRYWDGNCKNARVLNRALSQIEIQQNYLANKFRGNN